MDKTKPPSVDTLIKGIDQLMAKNHESLTVEELELLKSVRESLLDSSKSTVGNVMQKAVLNFILHKLFNYFFKDNFEEIKEIKTVLEEWISNLDK